MGIRAVGFAAALSTALAVASTASAAQQSGELTARDKSQVYIQHLVKILKLDPAKYQAMVLEYEIAQMLVEAKVIEADLLVDDFIRNSLRELYPLYARALDHLTKNEDDDARRVLRPLLANSDPYLAAYVGLLEAELDFRAGKYDEVIERCENLLIKDRLRLIGDHRACELIGLAFEKQELPLLAFAQYWILLVDYHDIPPAVESRVKEKVASLSGEFGRPLHTVAGWMNEVEKLLSEEDTSENPTQKKEGHIVAALDKLIELEEARERNTCSNCGSGSCDGGCRSGRGLGGGSPRRVSLLPGGEGGTVLRGVSAADPTSRWGLLGERNAARALQSFRGKLPARFERLLKEYYKALSREE